MVLKRYGDVRGKSAITACHCEAGYLCDPTELKAIYSQVSLAKIAVLAGSNKGRNEQIHITCTSWDSQDKP